MSWRWLALCAATLAVIWPISVRAAAEPGLAAEHEILVMIRQGADHYRPTGDYGGSYGDQLSQSARRRIATHIAARHGLTLTDNWPMPMIGVDCFVMIVPDGRSTAAAAEQVSHDREVVWAEPIGLYGARASAPPHKDPLFPAEPAATLWHLADLHRIATG